MENIKMLNEIVWGAPTLVALLAAGVYFTVGTGFFQLRHFWHCLKSTIFSSVGKSSDKGSISQFQAMSSALAATLGTGNIAGVAAAVATGGAGAVFWMWVSAFFGMMTGFAENVLGIYYRRKNADGEWAGGAMYYIGRGLSENRFTKPLAKPLAAVFAGLCVLSAFGMGNLAQMNSATGALKASFGIPPLVVGITLAAVECFIIFGGIKRIGSFTEKLIPFMSGFYMLGTLWIIAVNFQSLPSVFGAVFEGAFGIDAVSGGVSGYIIKQAVSLGFRRGIFSNEAGLGTSPAAHAASNVTEPCVQGMWSIFEVFFDTIVMCSLTAVILLASPCNVPTAEAAFQNISLKPQYFRLTDSDRIICGGAPVLEIGEGREVLCDTVNCSPFTVNVRAGELTFSNIMSVQGVQSRDENGNLLFMDRGRKLPLIESVEIREVSGTELSTFAFSQTFGSGAGKILSVAVLLFAFSTVIGWSYFGSSAAVYLFGKRTEKPFKWAFVTVTALGSVLDFSTALSVSDLINGLMAVPNIIALFVLSPKVFEITGNYCRRTFKGEKISPMLSRKQK